MVTKLQTESHTPDANVLSLINLNSCTLTDILYELDQLSINMKPGSDNISNLFFREYKVVLAVPLLYLPIKLVI